MRGHDRELPAGKSPTHAPHDRHRMTLTLRRWMSSQNRSRKAARRHLISTSAGSAEGARALVEIARDFLDPGNGLGIEHAPIGSRLISQDAVTVDRIARVGPD